jgi:hypothetical protein
MPFLTPYFFLRLLKQKSRCGGSGFLRFYLFQIHAIGRAAEVFHIIHIILQITWFISRFVL